MDTIELANIIALYLRPVSGWDMATTPPTPLFDPPLSASEQATLDRIKALVKSLVPGITPTEWQALEPSIAIGIQVLAAPPGTVMTAAQNLASHQAIWKVLRALLKN